MSNQTTTSNNETLPYLNNQGDLIIPFDSPERYHYWKTDALSIAKILAELNAPPEVVARYTKRPDE